MKKKFSRSLSNLTIVVERNGKEERRTLTDVKVTPMPDGMLRLSGAEGDVLVDKELWGFLGGEIFFGEGLPRRRQRRPSREPLWFARTFFRDARGFMRVALENPPYPNYEAMPDNKILDTQAVARRAGCSPITVLRHVREGRLKTHRKGSSAREFYYRKSDVEAWLSRTPEFKRGRPSARKREKS